MKVGLHRLKVQTGVLTVEQAHKRYPRKAKKA